MKAQFRPVQILAVVALTLMLLPPSVQAAENYAVDSAHTYIIFKIDHLGIGNSYGRFNNPRGSFRWDATNPANSEFKLMFAAADIDTANEKRDKHLRSPDFFNTDQHAQIVFQSTGVQKRQADTYEISGTLTMLGQTHPVVVSAVQTGYGEDPWGKYRRGFETTFTIKRSQWGMDYMLSGLSDEVEITVSLEGIRQ